MRLIISILILSTILTSCGDRHLVVDENLKRVINPISTKVTYAYLGENGIQKIFKAKCFMCHKAGGMNPKDWTKYEVAKKNIDLINNRVFIVADMPMAGELTADEKKMLKVWINEGAPLNLENKNNIKSFSDPANMVRFEGHGGIKELFVSKCSACHNGNFHAKDWSDYEVSKNNLGKINSRVFSVQDMPMVGSLTKEEKIKLKEWITSGGPF